MFLPFKKLKVLKGGIKKMTYYELTIEERMPVERDYYEQREIRSNPGASLFYVGVNPEIPSPPEHVDDRWIRENRNDNISSIVEQNR